MLRTVPSRIAEIARGNLSVSDAMIVAVVLALFSAAWGIIYQLTLSSSVPQNDIIDFYKQFLDAGGFAGYGLDLLYQRHNEHRLFVPKLWFLADIALVDARQTLLLTVISLSAVAHAGLIAALFRGLGQSRSATALAFIVAAGAMLSPVQWENLIQGFQVQFVQVWLFATLSFALIAWAPAEPGRGGVLALAVAGAALAGLCSTYSMINGLAVWPLLVIFALWRRLPAVWVLFLAAVGGAVLAVEVPGFFTRPGGGHLPGMQTDPLTVLRFMARYLTSAIDDIGSTGQEIVGSLAFAGLIIAGIHALVRPGRVSGVHMALLAASAFVLASAVTTAMGRLHMGLGAANTSRYATPSMVFLVICGLLVYDGLCRRQWPRLRAWFTLVGVALLLVPGLVHEGRSLLSRFVVRDFARMAIASHLAGGYRPQTLIFLYPHWPVRPDEVARAMQKAGLGPFSELQRFMPPASALADGPAVDAPACNGEVRFLRIDPVNGVTFGSWLSNAETGARPPWVVGRDQDGRVVAWGAEWEARGDYAPILDPGLFGRGHAAFGPVPDVPVERITVEGVFDDGRRCRLAGSFERMEPQRFALTPPPGSVPVKAEWELDGEVRAGASGPVPVPENVGPTFGSMAGLDTRFHASIALDDPAGATSLVLPIVTQRWPFEITISLERPDGTVVDREALKMPSSQRWVWLALRGDDLGPGMRLVIRTLKAYPSNGLAFGTPRWVR